MYLRGTGYVLKPTFLFGLAAFGSFEFYNIFKLSKKQGINLSDHNGGRRSKEQLLTGSYQSNELFYMHGYSYRSHVLDYCSSKIHLSANTSNPFLSPLVTFIKEDVLGVLPRSWMGCICCKRQ